MNDELKGKRIVITGVTGQMGSTLADLCLEKGARVVGTIRRLSVPNHANIAHIKDPKFSLETMDLGDVHSISATFRKHEPDLWIGCAANSFVGNSWKCPEQHIEFNTLGVLRQLEALREFPKTRFLNFGSSEEWGDVQYVPQDENHPLRARSPYGASKIAARQLVKVYRESYGLFAIQPWCTNYESERRGLEFITRKITSGVAKIVSQIKRGQEITPIVIGNLEARRDWSYCRDFAEGVLLMLNQSAPKEFVLASGIATTVRCFVELSFQRAGLPIIWHRTVNPLDEFATIDGHAIVLRISKEFFRPAEVDLLLGNSAKIRAELGWKPKVDLQGLVNIMVDHDLKCALRT